MVKTSPKFQRESRNLLGLSLQGTHLKCSMKMARISYIDPVLGATQLDDLQKNFANNIIARNKWEDFTAPAIASQLRDAFDLQIPARNNCCHSQMHGGELWRTQ